MDRNHPVQGVRPWTVCDEPARIRNHIFNNVVTFALTVLSLYLGQQPLEASAKLSISLLHLSTNFWGKALHIVPDIRLFPLSSLRQDMQLDTLASESAKLYVDRSVPSLVHIWATPKDQRDRDPTNFATILQWQDIQGEKAILYSIDNPLVPPALAKNLQKTEALQGP
eukprot:274614-Pelagomonas_calceolata.AAC.1